MALRDRVKLHPDRTPVSFGHLVSGKSRAFGDTAEVRLHDDLRRAGCDATANNAGRCAERPSEQADLEAPLRPARGVGAGRDLALGRA
jgi:hypothetical protein